MLALVSVLAVTCLALRKYYKVKYCSNEKTTSVHIQCTHPNYLDFTFRESYTASLPPTGLGSMRKKIWFNALLYYIVLL